MCQSNHFKSHIKWIPARVLKVTRFVHEKQIKESSLSHEHHHDKNEIILKKQIKKEEEAESYFSDEEPDYYLATSTNQGILKRQRSETTSESESERPSLEQEIRRSNRNRRAPKRFTFSDYV